MTVGEIQMEGSCKVVDPEVRKTFLTDHIVIKLAGSDLMSEQ